MLTIALVMALQAAPAASQQVALNMEAAAAATAESPASATEEAATPARKRVCRTALDTRTGLIAKQRKVCRFVDEATNRSD